MRRARLLTPHGPVEGRYDDGTITAPDGEYVVGRDGRLLPPCTPSALYCVGRNYAATLDQMDYDRPDAPDFFIKPPVSVIAHEQPIPYPTWSEELTYAGELVAVVGRRCARLAAREVSDVIRGYTIMNDVDALDQPGRTARKAFTGSAPLGPWLETDLDPRALDMHTVINDDTRQQASTDQMLFPPDEVVAFLSQRVVLQPGDAIAFGSPANPGTIESGDRIAITYDGIGTLCNRVASPSS